MAWRLRRIALSPPNDCSATNGTLRGQRNSSGVLGATHSILRLQRVSRRKDGIPEFPVTEGATVLMHTMALNEAKDPIISTLPGAVVRSVCAVR